MPMTPTIVSPFGLAREQVEEAVGAGEPLWRVEELLEDAQLDVHERDALWLLAWSLDRRLEPAQ